ncbi:uncharacterized protein EDB93DRAFT_1153973 [Suillus bovinus]|uniref:uncharacterized protein n=1 Tax=Suillus bovinus TaxID=48563 RepID=UPI001B86AAA6|nr:uncharacterized protein EDB93DRAFT_1153973 [Suillus bovinus]KAG2144150.1 hypothetical protein EDB93DRAFT_1153973 [Suillus bovinus]
MPPKRRAAAKSTPAPAKPPAPAPAPPKQTPPVKQAPPPPPPPPPIVESSSAKVRKEWLDFISTWYEPQKKKLLDQLTKELDAKYKKSTSRMQQNARHSELENKLSEITTQLAEPAHEEWNSRLAAQQLRVDDWTDITEQEQQSVIDVFNAFYDDNEEDHSTTPFDTGEIEEPMVSAVEEPQLGDSSPFLTIRQSPPTPITANFQLVNPSSFFTETISPAKQARKLPELAMDNLATLNNLSTGRTPADTSSSTSAVFGFQGWASEAALALPQSASQSNRNRATDNISRQPSSTAFASSPLFSSQTASNNSPPQPTSMSPLTATRNILPGQRYIGPVIAEEEAEPIDEELLKAKMAADFLEFKMEVRIQMIQQFHAKASAIEIELARQLESSNSTSSKESRLLTLHEHEENMMSLRESKELERKKLCDKERDRRLQEHRFLQQAAAQKAINQTRLNASASSSKIPPTSQPGWTTHAAPKLASQKENLSTGSLPTKLDPPSMLKKSASARSHDIIPGFDEAAFVKAQAEAASLAKGKQPAPTLNRPSALKKAEITSSHDEPVEPVIPSTAPTAHATKGKKGKKTQVDAQQPKTVTFNEEPGTDAEPPPAKGTKGARGSLSVMIEEEPDEDADPFSTWNPKTARATTPAPAKKGKAAVVAQEVVVEPVPLVASTPVWGSAAGKRDKAPAPPAEPTEESFQTWSAPGKNNKGKAPIIPAEPMEDPFQTWNVPRGPVSTKKTKVTVTEEADEEAGPAAVVWGAGLKGASAAAKKVVPQPEARRGAQSSSKSAVVQDAVEEEEDDEDDDEEWDQIRPASAIPGSLDTTSEAENDAWGSSYWGNLSNGQPISQPTNESASYWASLSKAHTNASESAQHMVWTPSMEAEESGDEEDLGETMESALWMQYAISGGEIPGFEAPDPQEDVHTHTHAHARVKSTPAATAPHKKTTNEPTMSIWEQGKGKKKSAPAIETRIETTHAAPQQVSASSSARTAQWPKAKMEMENWASRLGQSSGSARHL